VNRHSIELGRVQVHLIQGQPIFSRVGLKSARLHPSRPSLAPPNQD